MDCFVYLALSQVIDQFAYKYDDFAVVAQPCISEGTAANLTPEVVSKVYRDLHHYCVF